MDPRSSEQAASTPGKPQQDRDYTAVGPQLGVTFPDVVLPDQSGRPVDLHQARSGRRALVVFHRSARW